MTLALITIIYKNYDILRDFFQSLATQTDSDFNLYIADLTENPLDIAPLIASFPSISNKVHVIHSSNLGYSHGVNIGTKEAVKDKASQFAIVNPDIILRGDFVSAAKSAISNHPRSIISCKIYYAPGFEYHRTDKKDSGKVLWFAGGHVDWAHVSVHHRGVDEIDKGQYDSFEHTQYMSGCCALYDVSVVQNVGDWDESYFMYFEDADYGMRAIRKGISIFYDPSVVIWHKSSQSTGGSGSAFHNKWIGRNRIKFTLKYAPMRTKLHVLKNELVKRLRLGN